MRFLHVSPEIIRLRIAGSAHLALESHAGVMANIMSLDMRLLAEHLEANFAAPTHALSADPCHNTCNVSNKVRGISQTWIPWFG